MTHEIVFSEDAEDDLFSIASFITENADRETADGFIGRLTGACRRLADFPRRGTPHPQFGADVRSIPFERRATIFYLVEAKRVTIIHIAHAGRDPDRLFNSPTE